MLLHYQPQRVAKVNRKLDHLTRKNSLSSGKCKLQIVPRMGWENRILSSSVQHGIYEIKHREENPSLN